MRPCPAGAIHRASLIDGDTYNRGFCIFKGDRKAKVRRILGPRNVPW